MQQNQILKAVASSPFYNELNMIDFTTNIPEKRLITSINSANVIVNL